MSNEPKEGSVTAPQEPLKLTLEEGLSLAKKYMVAYLEESSWPDELREKWPEDLDADYRTLFERPVVPRDDAAELRAALAKMSDLVFTMLSAEDELSRAKGPGGSYPEDVAGYHAARRNAWEELCSLAQEHDDPDALRAALAATEGRDAP